MQVTDFDVLTFDCYGTLIDWDSGIYAALQPLQARVGRTIPRDEALESFARYESEQEAATPSLRYADLLAVVHGRLAHEWGVAPSQEEDQRFGASVPDWPAFADTAGALQYLGKHYKLVILSNVDRQSFEGTIPRLGATLEAIYTAEDIGSYKPDPRNFAYLLARLGEKGISPGRVLHTAQSLYHDHVPAKAAGLATAWIDRRQEGQGWDETVPLTYGAKPDFRFTSVAAMAEAHLRALRQAG